MNKSAAPVGWHSVTPRIFADRADELVAFVKEVFSATGRYERGAPSEIHIGDSRVMISGTEYRAAMPACLYVYVADADATYRRAIASGATSLEEPIDTPYGDRRAMVEDRWGNIWQIATRTS
jgi:uncharacterized glyoxalase superfamily protein PhnB